MSPEISVHDNSLLSYTVDSSEKCITLHTAYFDQEPYQFTDVVFTGVLAYHFEGDVFGTLLFDITETSAQHLYAAHKDLFERRKNYGWPVLSYRTVEELMQMLTSQNMRVFDISSSCGLNGFVMAQQMHWLSIPDPGIRPVFAGFPLFPSNL